MRDNGNGKAERQGAFGNGANGNGAPFSFDQFTSAFNGQGMQTFMQAGTAWMKALESVQREMVSFAQNRVNEGIARSQSLAKCTSMEELVSMQTEFLRSTMDSYIQETQKIAGMCSELAKPMAGEPAGGQSAKPAAGHD